MSLTPIGTGPLPALSPTTATPPVTSAPSVTGGLLSALERFLAPPDPLSSAIEDLKEATKAFGIIAADLEESNLPEDHLGDVVLSWVPPPLEFDVAAELRTIDSMRAQSDKAGASNVIQGGDGRLVLTIGG